MPARDAMILEFRPRPRPLPGAQEARGALRALGAWNSLILERMARHGAHVALLSELATIPAAPVALAAYPARVLAALTQVIADDSQANEGEIQAVGAVLAWLDGRADPPPSPSGERTPKLADERWGEFHGLVDTD